MERENIGYQEKINIGVPAGTADTLRNDAERFGIRKPGSGGINLNRFLSKLVLNYDALFKKERVDAAGKITDLLVPCLKEQEKKNVNILAEKIVQEILRADDRLPGEKKSVRLPLKPTEETSQIIDGIRSCGISVSRYLCSMFISYCEKPIYERERIIFSRSMKILEEACDGRSEIMFVTTTDRKNDVHIAIPYAVAVGRDEMANYLLCQEYDKRTGKYAAKSYRLCRIKEPPHYSGSFGSIHPGILKKLERMKMNNPQAAITEETDICIRLTREGRKSFQKMYFALPVVDRERIEYLEDGSALYHFYDSADLVFRFVIRFKAGEAEAVSPPEFREKVYRHFRKSIDLYEKD